MKYELFLPWATQQTVVRSSASVCCSWSACKQCAYAFPVHGAEIHLTSGTESFWMKHRRLALKEETRITIPTQSHDNFTFILSNLISFTFRQKGDGFVWIWTSHLYGVLWPAHAPLKVKVKGGVRDRIWLFCYKLYVFLQITLYEIHMKKKLILVRLGWIVHSELLFKTWLHSVLCIWIELATLDWNLNWNYQRFYFFYLIK